MSVLVAHTIIFLQKIFWFMVKLGDEILWRLPKNQWQNGWRAWWWVAIFTVSSSFTTMTANQLLFSWAVANPSTKLFLDSHRSIARQLEIFHVWRKWSGLVVNEFDPNFYGKYDQNSWEFENAMTWGLVECSEMCTLNTLRVIFFPRVSLSPPSRAGELEKKRDPGNEFAS